MDKDVVIFRIIRLLIIFQILFSLFLIYGDLTNNGVCNTVGCSEVQNSKYSEIYGVKLIYISLVCFLLLFLFFEKHMTLFQIAAVIGGLIAIALIAMQYFLIGSWCRDCLIIDITMIIILLLTIVVSKMQKKHGKISVNKYDSTQYGTGRIRRRRR